MGISFAGYNLLLPDGGRRVDDWFEKWIPYQDIRHISDWSTGVRNPLPAPLTQPNWARQLTPRLNTWYSPTGASRWGFGYFLADGATKNQIINSGSGSGGGYLNLTSSSGTQQLGRSIMAFCLPPHPVSADNSLSTSLWVLPIVDQRYYWQFVAKDAPGLGVQNGPTFGNWASIIGNMTSFLIGAQAVTIPQVPTAYLLPNQWDFERLSNQSTAVALDLALMSIGMRLVPDDFTLFGGNHTAGQGFAVHDWPTAASTRDANFSASETHGFLQGGVSNSVAGDLTSITPSQINVIYRSYQNGLAPSDEVLAATPYNITPSQTQLFQGISTGGMTKTIRSRAMANYTSGLGVDNSNTLNLLAIQIASDYWGWCSWFQDQVFPGISRQRQTGFDDYREYNCGTLASDGSRITRSRVHTMPHNFYLDDQLHWDNTVTNWTFAPVNYSGMTWEWGNMLVGTLQGPLLPNTQQVIQVTAADVPFPAPANNPTNYVLVNEVLGLTVAGGTVIAMRSGKQWNVVSPEAPPQVFYGQPTALTDCTAGATVTFNVFAGTLGMETATGSTISAFVRKGIVFANQTYKIEATAGGYECIDPSLQFRGKPGSDIATDASGSMLVWTGTGSGSASSLTISSIRNDTSCTVKASKFAYASWTDSLNGWAFPIFHSS